jgi:hypothetical protein
MNVPILARDACVGERNVGQGSRRELSSPRTESWRAKLLALTIAALILVSVILLSLRVGEGANTGGDGALLYPAGNLTRVAGAHVGGTTYRDGLGAEKTTTHGPFIAGKHGAFSLKGAG